jgi:diacylglycerol kinase family enzyme
MPPLAPAVPTRQAPLFIVMNARSGSGDAQESRQKMATILREAGQAHEFVLVERPEDLERQAKRAVQSAQERSGAVVAAGGDGTINVVAHAVLPCNLPFGIVPQGTFNYSGRAHSIPLDTEDATHALLHPRLKPIQVGAVNDRIFLVNVSLGLYPKALEEREEAEATFGRNRAVALGAGLRSLLQEHRQLSLEIEHDHEREIVRTPTLFIGNNQLQLERIGLPEADDVQNRQLAAVIVRTHKPASLLWLALRGALGQLGDAKNVRNFAFKQMSVNPWLRYGRRRIKVAIDGEVLNMKPPLRFSVAPQSLWLMTPRASDGNDGGDGSDVGDIGDIGQKRPVV